MNSKRPNRSNNRSACRAARVMAAMALGVAVYPSAAAVAAAPGPAARAPDTKSAVVTVADLDLATETGRESARRRVRDMARVLCRKFDDTRSVARMQTLTDCVSDTVAASEHSLRVDVAIVSSTQR